MATPEKASLAGPTRPLGSPEIPQYYLPSSGSGVYTPVVYGAATIHFADRKRKIDQTRHLAFLVPLEPGTKTLDWDAAKPTDVRPDQLVKEPKSPDKGKYLPLAAGAMEVKTFTRWAKGFDRWLARTQRLDVPPKPEGAAAADPPEPTSIGPKRGGVSVELVAIVWQRG